MYVLALACELTRPPDTLAGERRRALTAGHAKLLGVVPDSIDHFDREPLARGTSGALVVCYRLSPA